jgi:putative holliday junction resolvase
VASGECFTLFTPHSSRFTLHFFPRTPQFVVLGVRQVALALDVGDARIGVARGEVGSGFAFGRGFITRTKLTQDIQALKDVMETEKAELIVIGLPKSKDGSDSPQTQKVRAFARELEKAGVTVVLEDERFTTRLATQKLQNLPKHKRQEKGRLDEAAAILILEGYLARVKQDRVKQLSNLERESE